MNWAAMLDELMSDDSDTMSAWEVEFIESLGRQRMASSALWRPSVKQRDVLQRIWTKVFH